MKRITGLECSGRFNGHLKRRIVGERHRSGAQLYDLRSTFRVQFLPCIAMPCRHTIVRTKERAFRAFEPKKAINNEKIRPNRFYLDLGR
jgi:hypothetical protein